MKYPQAYLLIEGKYEWPSMDRLHAWCDGNHCYALGLSPIDVNLFHFIRKIAEVHRGCSGTRFSDESKFLVINVDEIPLQIVMALGEHLIKVYWLEDEDKVAIMDELSVSINNYYSIVNDLTNISYDVSQLTNYFENQESDFDLQVGDMYESYAVDHEAFEKVATDAFSQIADYHFYAGLQSNQKVFSVKGVHSSILNASANDVTN